MIQTIKDSSGKVVAYATWHALTKYMEFSPLHTPEELAVAYIDKFWRHPSCEKSVRNCIKQMVTECLEENPTLTHAVFNRHRNNGNKNSKFYTYDRSQMINSSGKGDLNGK